MDMFMDTWIREFRIIGNITNVNTCKFIFCWDIKIVECPTHEKHKIKCSTNKWQYKVTDEQQRVLTSMW